MSQQSFLETPAKCQPRAIEFTAYGTPVPKGSKTGTAIKTPGGGSRVIVYEKNRERQKAWASEIKLAAMMAVESCRFGTWKLMTGPVAVSIEFRFCRPKSHYGTGKNQFRLKPTAPTYHTQKPDVDKLQRCVLDALTGTLWRDDSCVCVMRDVQKVWTQEQPGAFIRVLEI